MDLSVCVCVCVHPWTKGFFRPIPLPLVQHRFQAGGRSRCKGLRLTKLPCIWEAEPDQLCVPAPTFEQAV